MKEIKTEDAIGSVLCHDITEIVKDQRKGPRFKKGHIIKEEDIEVLLNLGKEHLYVFAKDLNNIINNDAVKMMEKNNLYDLSVENSGLYQIPYKFYQGKTVEGIVVGGNIRCFLKLAGTEYFPDVTDKILLLEARSGNPAQIVTYFAQLEQLGVFKKVKGILLGTFTQMEREQPVPAVYSLLKRYINEELPVVKTEYIGHGEDSKAIQIGKKYKF